MPARDDLKITAIEFFFKLKKKTKQNRHPEQLKNIFPPPSLME